MISYRNELQALTKQKNIDDEKHRYATTVLNNALERERRDHEQKRKNLEELIASVSAERNSLHNELSALQTGLASTTAEECCRRGKEFVEYTDRAVDVGSRCTAELARKEQALKTCVRMYEGAKLVNDSTK